MNRKALLFGLAALTLIGLIAGISLLLTSRPRFYGAVIEPALPAPEIVLRDANGKTFRLSGLHGKVVLLFFGYAFCPDVCPTTLADLRVARAQLTKAEAENVQVVFITVDPQRDTPQNIQEYVLRFDPTFIGLSGSEADLAPVWSAYGIFRELATPSAEGYYLVSHTARVYLIDPQGNLFLSYSFGTPPNDVASDLRQLLK